MNPSNNILAESHVCPWWLIYTFDNPLRRLLQNPERILRGLVHPGDMCLDIGCGFGYFTIPMARLVGPSGSVTAVDLQPEMLAGLKRRAESAELLSRIRLHQADIAQLSLEKSCDFALAFWMVHEVPDQEALFQQVRLALKPDGRLLVVEPKGHVRKGAFDHTMTIAEQAGFTRVDDLRISLSRAVLMASDRASAGRNKQGN